MALQQALKHELVTRNVAALVDSPQVEKHEIHPWSADECMEFLDGVAGDRYAAAYVVALSLGLRQGEICGLRWVDVDILSAELRVNQARDRRSGKFGPPKSRQSRRVLSLPELTRTALAEHKSRQEEEQRVMGPDWNPYGLVFVTQLGTPVDGANLGHYFQRHIKRLGVRRIRFHDTRHSCASVLLAAGVSLREIMEQLGHSQIALTAETYTHIAPAMRRDVATRMDAALSRRGQVGGHLRVVKDA